MVCVKVADPWTEVVVIIWFAARDENIAWEMWIGGSPVPMRIQFLMLMFRIGFNFRLALLLLLDEWKDVSWSRFAGDANAKECSPKFKY